MRLTIEQYNQITSKTKQNKYHNKKVLYDNKKFDSIKEKRFYEKLKILERAGIIQELELQKKFELQPSFTDNTGKKQRAITYIVDFFYYEKTQEIYIAVDVKGYATDVYKIKKKMFMYQYPNIVFKEIK